MDNFYEEVYQYLIDEGIEEYDMRFKFQKDKINEKNT